MRDSALSPGADFLRRAEVVFYPGNERLTVVQAASGLDEHNHLTVDTVLSGSVPFLPPGASVTMEPFKETYQYYPSGEPLKETYQYSPSGEPARQPIRDRVRVWVRVRVRV